MTTPAPALTLQVFGDENRFDLVNEEVNRVLENLLNDRLTVSTVAAVNLRRSRRQRRV